VLLLPLAFQTKPHLVDPTETFRVWITDPPGMLDSLTDGATFSAELANWLVGEATDAMLAYGRSRNVDRFIFVHDWRGARAYDTAARLRIIGWAVAWCGKSTASTSPSPTTRRRSSGWPLPVGRWR